MRYRKKEAVFM